MELKPLSPSPLMGRGGFDQTWASIVKHKSINRFQFLPCPALTGPPRWSRERLPDQELLETQIRVHLLIYPRRKPRRLAARAPPVCELGGEPPEQFSAPGYMTSFSLHQNLGGEQQCRPQSPRPQGGRGSRWLASLRTRVQVRMASSAPTP